MSIQTVAFCEAQNTFARTESHTDSAFLFCRNHQMDTSFCILVDMSIHSGKNRLFIWDFKQRKVIRAGLCCHGCGQGSKVNLPVFSNRPGSYCTSLGKYKIGKRDYSRWGIHIHYKLHGLEATNNNAFKRIIVLHAHTPVPDREIYPHSLPLGYSLGCPVVSGNMMRVLDHMLRKATQPVLLWIYSK